MQEISDVDLSDWEEQACAPPGDQQQSRVARLISEVRRLRHQLADPNYLYAASRIHRQALLCRDAEIRELRRVIAELKKEAGK